MHIYNLLQNKVHVGGMKKAERKSRLHIIVIKYVLKAFHKEPLQPPLVYVFTNYLNTLKVHFKVLILQFCCCILLLHYNYSDFLLQSIYLTALATTYLADILHTKHTICILNIMHCYGLNYPVLCFTCTSYTLKMLFKHEVSDNKLNKRTYNDT